MAKRKAEIVNKPTKKPHKSSPEVQFSICLPSSLISYANASNLEQITNIAYQVAKAATIYNVPEIIILDVPTIDAQYEILESKANKAVKIDKKIKFNEILEPPVQQQIVPNQPQNVQENHNNHELFESLLQFFITPPYLVKAMLKDNKYTKKFKYAQTLPKLSTLPFMGNNGTHNDFKEGLSIPKKSPGNKKQRNKLKVTKYVNIGHAQPFELTQEVPVNVRVTVDLKNKTIVSPLHAYGVIGYKSSFGYHTRIARNFNEIFTKSAFPTGYTSSIYVNCANYFSSEPADTTNNIQLNSSENNRVLLVFGNPKDLEFSFKQDKSLSVPSFTDLFDQKLCIPPTIKVEDAVLIALTKLYNL
ncbi:hypothetical protein PSN45_001216 [Yamadazyma tenuis]|uniref:DUF171-domain-containing protein n=1 Tax=Candida tenuis (strain ATCC 10573 / BCRC 21748 / CBS 615 / JCM 9827 / NBRC 10315 / NRRL Y-1498 / VKM Y-70) TaxID=590646 RepID=G3B942_CANTC|nr:DUF171-domain-containing protein [Yamadazyma tenuis ATCC 10573]XP_006689102.1 uncharacterized protein CANTEDRAFT_115920 [Yamadazyma tenuis ATCC 10573]EGV62931.1 DUF171-domain-containing protein [Yamadazyma tenuis ATCC 10573]EGV62932.1 hypothetical protein CANTEDRAFT_115920 [Yamadazyma tenuis ATCC 10573]WEJ93742.1 hypothetical protein PSN45_001216 [Yamadazyma tenuis]